MTSHLLYADDLLVFVKGSFPVIYLGAPIVVGHLKVRDLEPLVTKLKRKVAGWKFKLLSQGGRLILLRHVLSSMATHLLAVLNKINALLYTFFWVESNGKQKRKWCALVHLFKPIREGGLNI